MPASALKRTALYDTHAALGAKMTGFGGWDMPLHYGSQIEEHRRVRQDAGMFDVSHMLSVDIDGDQARAFLRLVLANDAARLAHCGGALYSCMLNDDGCVIDDLIAYRLGEARYRLVVNAANAGTDLAWLARQRAASALAATIRPRHDLAMIAVQGPRARAAVWQALPHAREATENLKPFEAAECGAALLARTGYTGEDGFEIMLPAPNAPPLWSKLLVQNVAPAGLAARDTLRLEAGMNLCGQDMDETVTPMECALAWSVALEPAREFIGKPALLAQAPRFSLLGLVLLAKGVLRAHQQVATSRGAGEITSGTYSPSLNRSIALARLPRDTPIGDDVSVTIRDRTLAARVVKPPCVRHGKILIEVDAKH